MARGVKAITLNEGDGVACVKTIPENLAEIASISGNGLFKRTSAREFSVQGRGGKGSKIQKLNEGDWMVGFCPIISGAQNVLVVSTNSSIKLTVNDLPLLSKGALGNKSIKLGPKSNVVEIFSY